MGVFAFLFVFGLFGLTISVLVYVFRLTFSGSISGPATAAKICAVATVLGFLLFGLTDTHSSTVTKPSPVVAAPALTQVATTSSTLSTSQVVAIVEPTRVPPTATHVPPTVVPTATAALTLTTADLNYLNTMDNADQDAGNAVTKLGQQSGLIAKDLALADDPTWRAATLQDLLSLKQDAAIFQSVPQTSPELAAINANFHKVGQEIDQAAQDYANTIDALHNGDSTTASSDLTAFEGLLQQAAAQETTIKQQVQDLKKS